ncbi:MAG: ThuA domain-containing protein [Fimbriiglobus sp.]
MWACLLACALVVAEPDRFEQGSVPVEVLPTDPKLDKIVLVAGVMAPKLKSGEHEYFAGCAALAKLLKQTPGVFPVIVRDGKPKNPDVFKGAKAIVLFVEGADPHVVVKNNLIPEIDALAKSGAGIVHLHSAIDYNKDFHERSKAWAGAVWEKGYSLRAHWVTTLKSDAEHPIMNGVKPFPIDDGWLWKLRFVDGMKGVTPLLRTVGPKDAGKTSETDAIISWAYDRPEGGKSFTFTGGHLQESLKQEGYRKFLVNGILWSAGHTIPKEGAPVVLPDAEVMLHLDKKPAPAKKK